MPCDFSKVDKVTICGANNCLGQYLATILKRQEIIREIALYDDCNVRGLALDLQHMNTKIKVRPHSGDYAIKNALRHSDIVIITNGYDSILNEYDECKLKQNASILYKYGVKIASTCPEALVCIITPPITVMVPFFSEVMKTCGMYDPNKVFGVSSVLEMRANTIVGDYLSIDPAAVKVPIVGGTTACTAVPLLSHSTPYNEFTYNEMKQLTYAILDTFEDCKKLNTAAPLSTAYAVARFVLTLAAGLCTCNCAIQTAFIRSDVMSQVNYFASEVRTTTRGIIANYGLPKIHEFELELLSSSIATLGQDYQRALCLFDEACRCARADEIADYCQTNKPFIIKTPCPPCPPCIPTDVCLPKLPEHPCTPAKPKTSQISFCCEK